MNEIKQQVARARRRLVLEQFLRIAPWAMFATLLTAAVALAVPKIWFVPFIRSDAAWQQWVTGWVGGATAVGLAIAAIWTYLARRGAMEAAIEIDRRFGLKERVSSTLSLTPQQLETEAGHALLDDATRRVTQLDVRERFRVAPSWTLALPLLPTAIVATLALFVANAVPPKEIVAAEEAAARAKKQVRQSAEELKKKIEEQQKRAAEKGLDESQELLKKFQEGLDRLAKTEPTDKQQLLVKLNDLAKDAEKRREELGAVDKLRKQLDQLKNAEKGPADKIADALKDGDFQKAIEETKKLRDQLAKGELGEEQRRQLEKQMDALQKKLQEMADRHDQAKRDLQEQIRQKEKAGDQQGAAQLQQQLEQLQQQDKQASKLQQMAQKLGQAGQSLKDGDAQAAAEQLSQLKDDLAELQKESDELETLDEMMRQIADAKNSMNCKQCDGQGCQSCQNGGQSGKNSSGKSRSSQQGKEKGKGDGLGEGQGQGDRPEEKTDTGFYDTKVGAKPKAGEAYRAGSADGPNMTGKGARELREEVTSSLSSDPEPLTNQRLPRAQREQARQYFEQYQGKNSKAKP